MKNFWKNKKVLVTGHSGFKGTWLSLILTYLEAKVCGISLDYKLEENRELFKLLKDDLPNLTNCYVDIRDFSKISNIFENFEPDIVIHLAAQPLVIDSYIKPKETYEINVLGTLNILEAIRFSKSVKSFINVTTDKVYKNKNSIYSFREYDELNGFDPYSNSKSCSELITSTYKNVYFASRQVACSTCRAGNVIGGGDFSTNRIIPDCYKALSSDTKIIIRNPNSVRPYQHVLEPLFFYLLLAEKQYNNLSLSDSYNIGPYDQNFLTTEQLAGEFCKIWGKPNFYDINQNYDKFYKETEILKLDCTLAKIKLNWKPLLNVYETMKLTVDWYKAFYKKENITKIMKKQILWYFDKFNNSF